MPCKVVRYVVPYTSETPPQFFTRSAGKPPIVGRQTPDAQYAIKHALTIDISLLKLGHPFKAIILSWKSHLTSFRLTHRPLWSRFDLHSSR